MQAEDAMLQQPTLGRARAKRARRPHKPGTKVVTRRARPERLGADESLLEADAWEDYDYLLDEHDAIEEARTHGDTDDRLVD